MEKAKVTKVFMANPETEGKRIPAPSQWMDLTAAQQHADTMDHNAVILIANLHDYPFDIQESPDGLRYTCHQDIAHYEHVPAH